MAWDLYDFGRDEKRLSEMKEENKRLWLMMEEARRRYNALSPGQKAEHDRKQRESFVRGMMPTGDPRFD